MGGEDETTEEHGSTLFFKSGGQQTTAPDPEPPPRQGSAAPTTSAGGVRPGGVSARLQSGSRRRAVRGPAACSRLQPLAARRLHARSGAGWKRRLRYTLPAVPSLPAAAPGLRSLSPGQARVPAPAWPEARPLDQRARLPRGLRLPLRTRKRRRPERKESRAHPKPASPGRPLVPAGTAAQGGDEAAGR